MQGIYIAFYGFSQLKLLLNFQVMRLQSMCKFSRFRIDR
ncbi:hypothetical protein JOE25_000632 [Serratia sp. PL17]|nr:hypothetical protein [Serratia sp. PL17]